MDQFERLQWSTSPGSTYPHENRAQCTTTKLGQSPIVREVRFWTLYKDAGPGVVAVWNRQEGGGITHKYVLLTPVTETTWVLPETAGEPKASIHLQED